MSTSSTGILYYGFDFGEDFPWLYNKNNNEEFEEDIDPDEFIVNAFGGNGSLSYAKKREIQKESGIEFIIHCAYDYPMWGLGVSESLSRASRGYPLLLECLIVKPEWKDVLTTAMNKLGYEAEEDPSWILTSVYG